MNPSPGKSPPLKRQHPLPPPLLTVCSQVTRPGQAILADQVERVSRKSKCSSIQWKFWCFYLSTIKTTSQIWEISLGFVCVNLHLNDLMTTVTVFNFSRIWTRTLPESESRDTSSPPRWLQKVHPMHQPQQRRRAHMCHKSGIRPGCKNVYLS